MPQIVAAAYTWVVGALAEGGIASLFVRAAFSAILSVVSSKLFGPKANPGAGLTGMQTMMRSALEFRKVTYGQAIISGPITYNNLSGLNNPYLWYQIALTDGESEDLVSVLLDNDVIPKADIDWTAGTGASDGTGTGDVSTAKWVGDNSTAGVQIFYYLGDDDQPVCGVLDTAFVDIGTTHRLRGVTHLVCKLFYDEDTEEVWKDGPPRNIRAVIKGRKLYDPRLDSTQIIDPTTSPVTYGSGAHRAATASTWAWSDNPSLCVADYLVNIMGVGVTNVDWGAVADTADDCDVLVAIPTSSTEKRFTCNGSLSMGITHKDNLDSILSSMDGKLSYAGGVWKVRASVWEASSVTITADDLAGPVQVRGSAPKEGRFNGIRGFFTDPARAYEAAEFPHVSDTNYLTRDNSEVIQYDLQLPMTNTATMAQRIAFRLLEQGDNQIICTLQMNMAGAKIIAGDVVSITIDELSWSAKTFRCTEWERNADGTFKVTFTEDESGSYTDPNEIDYGAGNTGGVTLPTDAIPAPSNLSATGVYTGVALAWTNPPSSLYDFIQIYEDTNNSWSGATLIATVNSNTYLVPHNDNVTYYYWIRAVRTPDKLSIRDPDNDTTTISAADTGPGDSRVIGVGGNATNNVVSTTNAQAALQVNSDGDTYTRTGVGSSFASVGTWLITGTNSDYDYILSGSGDTPTSGSLDTWIGGATTTYWQLDETTDGNASKTFDGTLTWRDATTYEILASAAVRIKANVTV